MAALAAILAAIRDAPGTGRQHAENRGNGMKRIIAAACLIAAATPAYAGNPKDHTFHFDTTRKASQACADPTVLPQLVVDLEVDRANQRTDVDEDMLKLLNKGHCQPLIPALDHDHWSFVHTGVVTRFGKPTTVVLMQYVLGSPEVAQAHSQTGDLANGGGMWFLPDDLVDDARHHPGR
jgi:hypothetical protein